MTVTTSQAFIQALADGPGIVRISQASALSLGGTNTDPTRTSQAVTSVLIGRASEFVDVSQGVTQALVAYVGPCVKPYILSREVVLKLDGSALASVRAKSIKVNGDPINITSDDDNGFRTFMDEAGQNQVDIRVEGITVNNNLIKMILAGAKIMIDNLVMEFCGAGGKTFIKGAFLLANMERAGNYRDAVKFVATLYSSGAYVYERWIP
nr:hypothetical protein 30 [bacterium]